MFWVLVGSLNVLFWKSGSFFCCPNAHWFLETEVMRSYLTRTGTLGWVIWPGARIAHSQGILPEFCPPNLSVGMPTPLLHCNYISAPLHPPMPSTPPNRLDNCGFFKSLVVRLPYSLIFWQLWLLLVLRYSCNSLCGCTRRQCVSIHTSILTGSLQTLFYCTLQIYHFFSNWRFVATLQWRSLLAPFSNSICSLYVSASQFGNSCNNSNFIILLYLLL